LLDVGKILEKDRLIAVFGQVLQLLFQLLRLYEQTFLAPAQRSGRRARFFRPGGAAGKPHKLTRAQLAELVQSGLVSIQSHGWSHRNMAVLSPLALLWELVRSRARSSRSPGASAVASYYVPNDDDAPPPTVNVNVT